MSDFDKEMNESEETYYEVEKIIRKRTDDHGKVFYLVKWEGFPDAENTWEPLENLETIMDLIYKFEKEINQNGNEGSDDEDILYNASLEEKEEDLDLLKKKKKMEFLSHKTDSTCSQGHSFKVGTLPEVIKNKKRRRKHNDDKLILSKSIIQKKHHTDTPIFGDNFMKGNIECDQPKSIELAKMVNGELYFWVKWESRTDGTLPDDQLISHRYIKRKYPYILIDFYEERLRFGNTNISASSSTESKNIELTTHTNNNQFNNLNEMKLDS